MTYPTRYSIVPLAEVERRWDRLHKELVIKEYSAREIELMRLAYWYAVFTIAPSYAEQTDAAEFVAKSGHSPWREEARP